MAVQHYKTRMALNSKNEVNTVSMPKMTVRDHSIIRLGKQGENEVLQVIWRGIVPEWEEKYGAGEFQLAVRRNQDTAPYIANIELDGGDIVWTITSAETARVGDGECELTYTVGDSIAKSQIWTITVCESLTGQEPVDPPEPAKNWVDVVIKSSSDAKQSATQSAESAKQAAASREAIENMEAAAVSLPPNSKATVEKDLVEGKVKLTFGIPRGESDIFWLTTNLTMEDDQEGEVPINETAEEIISAYKSGKTFFWNIFLTEKDEEDEERKVTFVNTLKQSIVWDVLDVSNIMYIYFATSSFDLDGGYTASGGIIAINIHNNEMSAYISSKSVGILTDNLPVESKLNGAARNDFGLDTYGAYYDHVHPAPFPNWTKSIGKALFVNNDNETPSQAFEWRDVPNGDFTSKVGDFLKVAEVDAQGKPTKWTTDSIANAKGVNF